MQGLRHLGTEASSKPASRNLRSSPARCVHKANTSTTYMICSVLEQVTAAPDDAALPTKRSMASCRSLS